MATFQEMVTQARSSSGIHDNNKVGTFESVLAGIGSGLIGIPKGLFSLGATLMDLGVNSGKAAKVEQWFDDLTEWDEKAEATAAGKIAEVLVNVGIPGTIGGGIRMNSGCYGDDISKILISVQVMDFDGNVKTIPSSDIKFYYRGSSLDNNLIIISATFKGKKDNIFNVLL